MGKRKVKYEPEAAQSIAAVSLYIESKGLIATADKFIDSVYDFIDGLADVRKGNPLCREPRRAALNYKCVSFRKKYTAVFSESESELIVHEFISSKMLHW